MEKGQPDSSRPSHLQEESSSPNPRQPLANPCYDLANPSPILANPHPILANPSPILANPHPILVNPSPILVNSCPILANTLSILDGVGVNVIIFVLLHLQERRGEELTQSWSEYSDTLFSLRSGGEAGQGLYSVD